MRCTDASFKYKSVFHKNSTLNRDCVFANEKSTFTVCNFDKRSKRFVMILYVLFPHKLHMV